MGWGGDVAGALMLVVTLVVTMRLWDASQAFLTRAGGMPPDPSGWGCGPSTVAGCQAYAQAMLPGLHLRVLWWTAAWVCLVFAGGGALLCVSGLRWAFWRVRAVIAA